MFHQSYDRLNQFFLTWNKTLAFMLTNSQPPPLCKGLFFHKKVKEFIGSESKPAFLCCLMQVISNEFIISAIHSQTVLISFVYDNCKLTKVYVVITMPKSTTKHFLVQTGVCLCCESVKKMLLILKKTGKWSPSTVYNYCKHWMQHCSNLIPNLIGWTVSTNGAI